MRSIPPATARRRAAAGEWRQGTARAATIGQQARTLAETKYSYAAYLERTREACAALMASPPAVAVVKDVA